MSPSILRLLRPWAFSVLSVAACAPGPDTILVNAKVFTANAETPWAEAIAVSGERIIAVGDSATVASMATPRTRRIDVEGRTILPGQIEPGERVSAVTSDAVRAKAADAYAVGVTSIGASVDGAMKDAAGAFVNAAPELRIRLMRRPVPGIDGHTDSRPFFPPQPTLRIDVKGMSFDFGPADLERLSLAVGWAYGSEDPLSVRAESVEVIDAYLTALERGSPEVWRAKRPRLEGPVVVPERLHPRLKQFGVVVMQRPGVAMSLKSLLDAGVHVAYAPGLASRFEEVRRALHDVLDAERVSAADVVRMMTTSAAYAEFRDDQQGQIAPGMLADLSVLSADLFSVAPDEIADVRSVLTMIGGRVVRDTGVIR